MRCVLSYDSAIQRYPVASTSSILRLQLLLTFCLQLGRTEQSECIQPQESSRGGCLRRCMQSPLRVHRGNRQDVLKTIMIAQHRANRSVPQAATMSICACGMLGMWSGHCSLPICPVVAACGVFPGTPWTSRSSCAHACRTGSPS